MAKLFMILAASMALAAVSALENVEGDTVRVVRDSHWGGPGIGVGMLGGSAASAAASSANSGSGGLLWGGPGIGRIGYGSGIGRVGYGSGIGRIGSGGIGVGNGVGIVGSTWDRPVVIESVGRRGKKWY